jgi:bifunctional non-homologous end joining protein LigD
MAGRVLFPRTQFATDDLASAYEHLAPVLLPHLAFRPLTLKRFPDDIHGEMFWEKDAPSFTPSFVQRLPVARKGEAGVINYMNLADAKSLRWAASVGCIEIHAFLHRYPFISSPTLVAFDLDPGPGVTLTDCCAVALEIHEWFEDRKLQNFAKLSGSKGLQVYVPLNTASSYAATQALSRRVAEELERRYPSAVISRMARAERAGKVFIDWSQNAEHKTTVSVYSIRAKHGQPLVSIPLTWTEVERAVSKQRSENLMFTPAEAIARVRELGDLFAPVLTLKQSLPESLVSELGLPHILEPVAVKVAEVTAGPYRPVRIREGAGRQNR